MAQDLLFDRIDTRIALDKEDGDHAYFHALSLKLEYLAKIVTAGIVACVGDDVDRQRYSLEHRLVRADSLGTWIETLHSALDSPSGQLFSGDALNLARDLTQRVSLGDWRYTAVTTLNQAAREIGVETQLGNRVALRQFFDLCVSLRNRSRGGYVNRCVNDIRRRPSQPLIQWRFHPHTVHRGRRLRSTQGPSDA